MGAVFGALFLFRAKQRTWLLKTFFYKKISQKKTFLTLFFRLVESSVEN